MKALQALLTLRNGRISSNASLSMAQQTNSSMEAKENAVLHA